MLWAFRKFNDNTYQNVYFLLNRIRVYVVPFVRKLLCSDGMGQ